jgi:hypothetical protein
MLSFMTGQQERQTCLYSSFKDLYVNLDVGQLGRHGNGAVCRHIPSLLQTLITNIVFTSQEPSGQRTLHRLKVC